MAQGLKIAVNTRFLIKDKLEGIGRFTSETLQRITQSHPQHQFYFLFDRKNYEPFIFGANITPVVLSPPARHPLLWYYWFEHSIPKALRRIQPHLFLSPDGFASLKTEVPTLSVFHDIAFEHYPQFIPYLNRKFYQYYSPKYAKRVQRIATVSQFSKKDIIEKYKLSDKKIDVVYNGANPTCKPLSPVQKKNVLQQYTNGCPYFIFISAVHPRKNLPRILQAFNLLKQQTQSNTKLVVAGRMAWKNKNIHTVLNTMQHKEAVIFTGHLPIGEIEKLTGAALALCYTSLFEGFGLPILEAMYAETPVITSTTSSMPEVAGDAALLVNPTETEAIYKAMLQIEQQPDLRTCLIEKGKIQRSQFTWERTANLLWESMTKLLH